MNVGNDITDVQEALYGTLKSLAASTKSFLISKSAWWMCTRRETQMELLQRWKLAVASPSEEAASGEPGPRVPEGGTDGCLQGLLVGRMSFQKKVTLALTSIVESMETA